MERFGQVLGNFLVCMSETADMQGRMQWEVRTWCRLVCGCCARFPRLSLGQPLAAIRRLCTPTSRKIWVSKRLINLSGVSPGYPTSTSCCRDW